MHAVARMKTTTADVGVVNMTSRIVAIHASPTIAIHPDRTVSVTLGVRAAPMREPTVNPALTKPMVSESWPTSRMVKTTQEVAVNTRRLTSGAQKMVRRTTTSCHTARRPCR